MGQKTEEGETISKRDTQAQMSKIGTCTDCSSWYGGCPMAGHVARWLLPATLLPTCPLIISPRFFLLRTRTPHTPIHCTKRAAPLHKTRKPKIFMRSRNARTSGPALLPHLRLILWPLNRRLVGVLSINRNSNSNIEWPLADFRGP